MNRMLITIASALLAIGASAAEKGADKQPSEADIQKIAAAVPAEAPAKPKQARKILVFSRTNGFRHSAIPWGHKAIELIGQKTGAYASTHTEDPAAFEEESLKQYDGVLMLNTTGAAFGPKKGETSPEAVAKEEVYKANFQKFIESGKGLMGIHAATDTYGNWPWYVAAIGGNFDGHPWHKEVPVHLEDPAHPCNACFEGKDFKIADEIYQYKNYDASQCHILLRLDTSWPELSKGKRKDLDYPIGWVKSAGQARVWYCNLGHREATYANPLVLKHFLAGIQFALGDLDGPIKPQGKPGEAAPAGGDAK